MISPKPTHSHLHTRLRCARTHVHAHLHTPHITHQNYFSLSLSLSLPLTQSRIQTICYFHSTVDSLYLEHPLSRTSLYLEQFSLSLRHFHWFQPNFLSISNLHISNFSLSRTKILVPCRFFSPCIELFSLHIACKGRPFSALSQRAGGFILVRLK